MVNASAVYVSILRQRCRRTDKRMVNSILLIVIAKKK